MDKPPPDAADHAKDFSRRYADDIDLAVSQRMMDLGIRTDQIGLPDRIRGVQNAAFHPDGTEGGNVSPAGRLIVDSGLFNDNLLKSDYGEAGALFAKSRLRDRLDSIIAHEYEEHRHGMSHVEALKHTPDTKLPISENARGIARAMEKGWPRGEPDH